MPKAKIVIALDTALLRRLDVLIADGGFPDRSAAIEAAVSEKLERRRPFRIARECGKLDRADERRLADAGLRADFDDWPAY
jgi:Arc/MetJ-type ribon-helix-helix transcriptional regulator